MCHLCNQSFAGLFLRSPKRKLDNALSVSETKNVDVTKLVGGVDDDRLKEESELYKHFLVDSDRDWVAYSLQFCQGPTGCVDLELKTRHSDRKAQMRNKLDFCIWLCAQAYRRWNLSVILCTPEQQFDGAMEKCVVERSFGKKQEYDK